MSHPDQFFGGKTYSQHGEDLMICNLFWLMGVARPSYLDIGAHHPWNISNTALLYKRGSRGVNVEANPNLIEEFRQARPEDVNVNVGVGPVPATLPFYMVDGWSGRNSFVKGVVERFVHENPRFCISEVRQVPVVPINGVVEQYCGGVWPDLLTIDVEGLDYDVLKAADFSGSRPKVVCVEACQDTVLPALINKVMESKGYRAHTRMVSNLIFVDAKYLGVLP